MIFPAMTTFCRASETISKPRLSEVLLRPLVESCPDRSVVGVAITEVVIGAHFEFVHGMDLPLRSPRWVAASRFLPFARFVTAIEEKLARDLHGKVRCLF